MRVVCLKNVFIFFLIGHLCAQDNFHYNEKSLSSLVNEDSLKSFLNSEVELTQSVAKERETVNLLFLRKIDVDRLLYNFRINAGLPSSVKPLEGWESPSIGLRGHFLGHYLSASAIIIERYNDPELIRNVDHIIDELAICQVSLGGYYLSAFPERELDILEEKFGGVWAPYYTLHKICQGLLDIYIHTYNKKAYDILLKEVEYIKKRMFRLSDDTIEKILYTAQANPLNEPGGMNDFLHQLYKISQNPDHLKLAKLFDRKWLYQPLADNQDILSGLHSNTHLVLINGFLKRFQNTREIAFKHAAINFWDILIYHHAFVNGSSSGPRPLATTPTSKISEHWGDRDQLSTSLNGKIAEACVTHNTQKLTANLFKITADPKYAEQYMNSYINAVLPLQNPTNGMSVYHLNLGSPRKKEFLKENDFKCCSGTSLEAFTQLNGNIYFHNENDIWINLYVPSKLKWLDKKIKIEQFGNFFKDSKIDIHVDLSAPLRFSVNLFIPSWANDKTKILINGRELKDKIKPNSFYVIDRVWAKGDEIKIKFDFDFYFKNMNDSLNTFAVFYGPFLLAFETEGELLLKGSKNEILRSLKKNKDTLRFTLYNDSKVYNLLPFFRVTDQSYGVYATLKNE